MVAIKRASYAIGSVLLASTLAACGGSSPGNSGADDDGDSAAAEEFVAQSADEIVKAAIADMEGLTSVQVNADIETADTAITLDLQLSTSGDCTGTVGLDGATAEVLSAGGSSWFKPDAEFFAKVLPPEQVDAVAEAVDGKYLADDQDQFASFCDLEDLLSNITDFNADDDVTKGDEDEVDGQATIIIEGTTDDGDPSQAFIATGDKHYILKFAATGEEPGEVIFSKFDEDFEVTAPSDDEVADLGSLG